MKREIKIGLAGIVALVILFLGINFLKGASLFNSSENYYISFRNAKGLAKSSTVYADGFNVGIVSDVIYKRPGEVVVEITVNDGVKIPRGTLASLDEGMLGGCTLNMTMGANPADCYQAGDTLQGSDANGLMAAAADVIPQVQQVLAHVDSLVLTLNAVASDPHIGEILQNAEQITENAKRLTADLNRSSEKLNQLLGNDIPQLAATFNKTGQNLNTLSGNLAQLDIQSTLDKVDKTVDNLHNATLKLNSPDNNLGLLLNDTALYGNLNTTMNSASSLLQDLKQHPSRYINVTVFGGRKKNKDKE